MDSCEWGKKESPTWSPLEFSRTTFESHLKFSAKTQLLKELVAVRDIPQTLQFRSTHQQSIFLASLVAKPFFLLWFWQVAHTHSCAIRTTDCIKFRRKPVQTIVLVVENTHSIRLVFASVSDHWLDSSNAYGFSMLVLCPESLKSFSAKIFSNKTLVAADIWPWGNQHRGHLFKYDWDRLNRRESIPGNPMKNLKGGELIAESALIDHSIQSNVGLWRFLDQSHLISRTLSQFRCDQMLDQSLNWIQTRIANKHRLIQYDFKWPISM